MLLFINYTMSKTYLFFDIWFKHGPSCVLLNVPIANGHSVTQKIQSSLFIHQIKKWNRLCYYWY